MASVNIEPVCRGEDALQTFVMYYPDAAASSGSALDGPVPDITVRGSKSPYSDFFRKGAVVELGPVLYRIRLPCSVCEALLTLAAYGVHVDFVEMFHEEDWRQVITSCVDMRKDGPEKAELAASFPRHYVVQTRRRLPFAVVDRFKQGPNVDFAAGRFDLKAVVSQFLRRDDAAEWCRAANERGRE